MSDEAALQAAIRAQPTEAAAKLVYADWLDEHDRHVDAAIMRVLADPESDELRLAFAAACEAAGEGARAEFVRGQVELSNLARAAGARRSGVYGPFESARRHNLLTRERELLTHENCVFLGDLSGLVPGAIEADGGAQCFAWFDHTATLRECVYPVEFRRGFPWRVTLPTEAWFAHGDAILAAHPVRRVWLTTRPQTEGQYQGGKLLAILVGRDAWHEFPQAVVDTNDIVRGLFAAEWPGVEFELPPPVNVGPGFVPAV